MLKLKKQKLILIFLSLFSILVISACSSNTNSSNNASNSSKGNRDSSKNSPYSQGVTNKEILVGTLGPQTGPVAIYDLVRKGIDSYFKYVNENGGVNGRTLKLVAYDDQYQPAKTVKQAKRLVEEDRVFATLGNICTPCNTAAQDYYVKQGIPMVMIGTGAHQFVDPPVKNYMGSAFMNYKVEAKIFLDYAVKKLGAKKIALAYQNDDFGKEGYEAVKKIIGNYPGVEIVTEVNFQSSDVELSSQAQKIEEANPDVVLNFSVPNPAANLKKAMHKIGLKDVPYIVSSVGANDNNLFNLAGADVWEGTISSATFPMPDQAQDNEDMKLYVERFRKDYPNDPVAGFGQIGWAAGQVFVEAIKRTGDDLTWDNFLKTFNTFDNWQGSMYEGVSLSDENHYGLLSSIMTEAKNGAIVPISKTITFDPKTGEIKYSE